MYYRNKEKRKIAKLNNLTKTCCTVFFNRQLYILFISFYLVPIVAIVLFNFEKFFEGLFILFLLSANKLFQLFQWPKSKFSRKRMVLGIFFHLLGFFFRGSGIFNHLGLATLMYFYIIFSYLQSEVQIMVTRCQPLYSTSTRLKCAKVNFKFPSFEGRNTCFVFCVQKESNL